MKSFQKFNDYQILEESLNTPVEFYLTDDTQLPVRIYGAFDIDDTTYGMSLEQSNHQGIYILQMYRILSKKPRKWSFKSPSHIRPALSTLLKFMEACVPFVKSQMKGIMITVSGKNTSRYVSFAERVLRRSYITSFKVLQTIKPDDQKKYDWESIFVSRIGISPKAVFSDSKFKKYDFSDDTMPQDAAVEISSKKPEKKVLKTEPSKKYTFGQLEIENITIDSQIFDLISKVEKDTSVSKKSNTAAKIHKDVVSEYNNLTYDNKEFLKYFEQGGQQKKIANFLDLVNQDPAMVLTALVKTFLDENPKAAINNTYDIEGIIQYVFSAGSNKHTKKYLQIMNIIDPIHGTGYSTLNAILKNIKNNVPKKTAQNKIIQSLNQYEKTIPKKSNFKKSEGNADNWNAPIVYKTNISPETLTSGVPGQGSFEYISNMNDMYHGYTYKNVDVYQTRRYIENELGYEKIISNHPNKENLYSYTGSSYRFINTTLRSSFNELIDENMQVSSFNKKQMETGSISKVTSMFDSMPPLPVSMWVYRDTQLPEEVRESLEAGNDFVDPAFLSTSINPKLNWREYAKFRIFVPKGSQVIPALSNSKHSTEEEIVLPPFSILKIIRLDEFPQNKEKLIVTCIYVGSAFKDFKQKFLEKSQKIQESSTTKAPVPFGKRNKEEYNPADKFGVKTDPKTLASALSFVKGLKKK